MRIHLKHMGRRHNFRELPETITVCHKFTPSSSNKIKVATIPFGKRYFEADPCKPCDALIAQSATPQQLRDYYRPECCPQCK